jgi:hypothetical protein
MRRGLWMLAAAAGLLGACSNKSSNTKIMVVVWSNLAVPTEIDTIRVAVIGSSTPQSVDFPLTAGNESGKTKLPVVLELVSPDDKAGEFEVVATGLEANNPVVSQAARLSFDPGLAHVLTLFLDGRCRYEACAGGDSADPVPVDVNRLPIYDPTAAFVRPDAGTSGPRDASGDSAETGSVDLVADLPQFGDVALDNPVVAPDAGRESSAETPRGSDAATDIAPDLAAIAPDLAASDIVSLDLILPDAVGPDLAAPDGPLECGSSASGCPPSGDTATDGAVDSPLTVLDARSDAPADTRDSRDAATDTPSDLTTPAETGGEVAPPDGGSACVLPMTTCPDGCINPQTNINNCGGCGQACSTKNGTPSCAAGACSMSACSSGFLDCSADENASRDGCETNSNTDSANCGRCGNSCSSRVCRSQACLATARYGNTGPGVYPPSPFDKGFLAGIQVYIPNASVVTGFGVVLYDGTASSKMYLGLYEDVTGNPGNLVATTQTSPTLVAPGGQELAVNPPVDVNKGTYWILGEWDVLATFASNTTTTVTWSFASYEFGALPATAPTSMSTLSLAPPNLYVIVAQ